MSAPEQGPCLRLRSWLILGSFFPLSEGSGLGNACPLLSREDTGGQFVKPTAEVSTDSGPRVSFSWAPPGRCFTKKQSFPSAGPLVYSPKTTQLSPCPLPNFMSLSFPIVKACTIYILSGNLRSHHCLAPVPGVDSLLWPVLSEWVSHSSFFPHSSYALVIRGSWPEG